LGWYWGRLYRLASTARVFASNMAVHKELRWFDIQLLCDIFPNPH
jgi:hypothetical protein